MELNITHLIEADNMMDYSASVAEIGTNAGRDTWNAAMEEFDTDYGDMKPLVNGDDIQTAKDYFGEFGAWDDEERATWTDQEVNALLLQFIAGDIREAGDDLTEDYEAYQARAEAGEISGNIFKCDIEGHESFGQWFIYIGN